MFTWGGCITKLLISVAFACVGAKLGSPVSICVFAGVMVYSLISSWWYFCCLLDHVLIGSLVFVGVFALACWGSVAAPVTALRVICLLGLAAITLGGAIADIWGMIQAIRYGL